MEAQNKIALVTGGSRGLGKDMATRLAEYGNDVIITYHSQKEAADGVVAQIESSGKNAAAIQYDSSDFKSLGNFLGEVSQTLQNKWSTDKFDFLINNAGIGATIPYAQVTEEDFDKFLNIHFKSIYFLTQRALPMMNDNGRIINISTGTTRFANPGYSVYASMKGAIEVFTRYVAKEVGSRGITVNVVAPGPIETDFNNAAIRNNPERKKIMSSLTALGRTGVAEDVGGVIAFLCTEDARWINGQRIEVSGGINL
jgi:NAD(P)-dependent dehydrogenase (short-subunit alcohol dehydrogenase family)